MDRNFPVAANGWARFAGSSAQQVAKRIRTGPRRQRRHPKRASDKEKKREAVNAWIRSSGAFDRGIDFDAATRDPTNPKHIVAKHDPGDHLHPQDVGYKAMADSIDPTLLSPRRWRSHRYALAHRSGTGERVHADLPSTCGRAVTNVTTEP